MSFETDSESVMKGLAVQEAIADLIWALIPEHTRDTTAPIQSFTDAKNTLMDAVSDKLDEMESIYNADGSVDLAYKSCRGIS